MKAEAYRLDPYILDTLMADLVGHDHRPSAFLVYLAIHAAASQGRAALSHAELAERTGLSKRSVQTAVAHLRRRELIATRQSGPTEIIDYQPLTPWRRSS
jgi:DNA-binding MarR family transcriptional regulator